MNYPKITCKCGSDFTPNYRNGILISKLCPDCRYTAEMSNRLAKRKETVIVEVKEAKKALKSKQVCTMVTVQDIIHYQAMI